MYLKKDIYLVRFTLQFYFVAFHDFLDGCTHITKPRINACRSNACLRSLQKNEANNFLGRVTDRMKGGKGFLVLLGSPNPFSSLAKHEYTKRSAICKTEKSGEEQT